MSTNNVDTLPKASQKITQQIVEDLRPLKPLKVILFGDYACENSTTDNDLDLLVVLDRDDMPQTYSQRSDLYLSVSRLVREVTRQVPINLIVHTQPMHEKFIETGSLFAQAILRKGVTLYEADHERVA